jgi:hypothetical protein
MITMDWRTHQYLHNTIGCRYASGLGISGYTINVSGDTNVQVGFANGICYDEDLMFLITNGVSGTPASTTNYYYQPLTKPATIPVFYQLGATGIWRKQVTANFYLYPDANPRPYYNLNTAGTWSLASTPSGDYVSYWIFASNDIDNPIIAIMGQQINTTLTNAVNNDVYSALSIASSGLPFVEMKLLYQIILSVSNAYGGSTSSRVAQVNDFRSASLIGGVAPSVGNFITSVDPSYFTVSAGALSFAGVHAQAIGSGDSPSFTGLTVGSNTGIATLTSGVLGSESTVTTTQLGTAVTPATLSGSGAVPAGWTIPFSQVSSIGNIVSSLTTESGAGITLTATNPTGQGAAYYVPSITGNLVIGSYGITFTAIADASVSGKLFLSSTTANVMKYYDNTPALHSIAVLDLAQSFSGIQTFTAKPVINISGSGSVLDLYNPANTHYYTLTTGAIGGNYALNLPVITGADTLAVLGLAQTFSTLQTFGAGIALSNSQTIAFGTGGGITFTDATAIIGSATQYVATEYVNNITFEGASAQLAGTYEIAGTPTVFSTLAFNGTALNIGSSSNYPAIIYTNALTGEGSTPTITGFSLAGTYNIGGTPTLNATLALNSQTLSGSGTFSGTITFTSEPIINISGSGAVLRLYNPANIYYYTLTTGAIGSNYVLNIPVITAADTLATLGLAQTFTAIQTIQLAQAELIINSTTSGNQSYIELENSASGYIGYLGIVATAGQLSTSSVVGDVVIRSNSAGILFAASTTQTMYIASNGNVSIAGNITMSSTLKMASSNFGLFCNGSAIYLANIGSSNGLSVDGSGNCASAGTFSIGTVANTTSHAAYLTGATSASVGYNTSCLRFKDNIENIEDASWIYNLRPVEFDWKDPERAKLEGRMVGLIAEEVEAQYSKICEYEKGELTGLHYEWLAVPMIVELRKLRDRVDQLEKVLQAEGILVNKP